MPLHQSTVKDYLNCPMMFYLKHVEKLTDEFRSPAMLHGTVLHKIIEIIHKSYWNFDVPNNYRHLMNETEYNGRDSRIPVKWDDRDKQIEEFIQNANEIITNYREKEYNKSCRVLLSEAPFRVKIGGVDYEGTIDQVRRMPNDELILVDFKSGSIRPDLVMVENDIQFSIYQIALAEGEFNINGLWVRPRLSVDKCSIYFLRSHEVYKRNCANGKVGDEKDQNAMIISNRNSRDIEGFKAEIQQIHRAINQQLFYRNNYGCRFCHLKNVCSSMNNLIPGEEINQARNMIDELNKEVA